jgi:hypothetical protein
MIFRGQSGRVLSTAAYAMSTLPEGGRWIRFVPLIAFVTIRFLITFLANR